MPLPDPTTALSTRPEAPISPRTITFHDIP